MVVKNFDFDVLTDLNVSSTPEYDKGIFRMTPDCIHVCVPP
jgi:hypothetical protein